MSETPEYDDPSVYRAYVTTADPLRLERLDSSESLPTLVQEILELWLEDDVPFAVLIRDQEGEVQASMFPGQNPERAVVAYRDGRLEQYEVRYCLDAEGKYSHSEVTPVVAG